MAKRAWIILTPLFVMRFEDLACSKVEIILTSLWPSCWEGGLTWSWPSFCPFSSFCPFCHALGRQGRKGQDKMYLFSWVWVMKGVCDKMFLTFAMHLESLERGVEMILHWPSSLYAPLGWHGGEMIVTSSPQYHACSSFRLEGWDYLGIPHLNCNASLGVEMILTPPLPLPNKMTMDIK